MGACGSTESGNAEGGQVSSTSLLLLGAPGVGKSTVFKQMQVLYKDGFSDELKADMAGNIVENILQATQVVGLAALDLDIAITDDTEKSLEEDLEKPLVELKCRNSGDPPPVIEIWDKITAIWNDPGMDKALDVLLSPDPPESVNQYKVEPSIAYFLDKPWDENRETNYDRIKTPGYRPNKEDLLRMRRVTEEAVTIEFIVKMNFPPGSDGYKNMQVSCTDVGGQAHHEYDWRKYSEITNAVLYVAALSEFCVVKPASPPMPPTNTLQHQFDLLAKVYASPAFENKEIIIMLNKDDLLEERLKKTKLAKYFTNYRGDNSKTSVIDYFTKKIESMLKTAASNAGSERMAPRTVNTTALNTQFVEKILLEFFISIITRNMADCGFLSMDD